MKLSSVRAVITGGASGLGNAVAQRLVGAGAQVTLIDVNEAAGQAAAKTLGAAARFQKVDVTNEAALTAAMAQARSDWSESLRQPRDIGRGRGDMLLFRSVKNRSFSTQPYRDVLAGGPENQHVPPASASHHRRTQNRGR